MRVAGATWHEGLGHPALLAAFAIGFCILFAFIGTFTYINFVLVAAPFQLGMMSLGLVYFVFLPSIVTTPLTSHVVRRFGARATLWGALGVAGIGLPLLLGSGLPAVMTGLALVGIGTFAAQAAATGFVGRLAARNRGVASGLYLASYFLGGLAGSAVLGPLLVADGWPACVAGIGIALASAGLFTAFLRPRQDHGTDSSMRRWHGTDRHSAMAATGLPGDALSDTVRKEVSP
jgi:predicted MFS family arabinose efflux permease